jgi:hypothetical protein
LVKEKRVAFTTAVGYEKVFGPKKQKAQRLRDKGQQLKDQGRTSGTFIQGKLQPEDIPSSATSNNAGKYL